MALTVREFVFQMYRLISAGSPTSTLYGDDEKIAIRILNQILQSYASSGLMLTIAKTLTIPINLPVREIIFTDSLYVPPVDPSVVQISQGRLANLNNAWLVLNGVNYPLTIKSRDEFLSAWKYEPLQGLPRFLITFPDTVIVRAQLYPAPSQFYDFFCRGKFQLPSLTSNDDMSLVPEYYHLYLQYAVAKYVSKFKGRASAWTSDLENDYRELKDNMESASEVNLSIDGDQQSLLNGAWRVMAGI